MHYRWNPDAMTAVFALPHIVVTRHIKLAGSAQLKVLLWLSCTGQGDFDEGACSAAIGVSQADCKDALQYWVETGVLQAAGTPSVPAVQPAPPPPVQQPEAVFVPRPQAVKPRFEEVLQRQKTSQEFAYLLDTASARLGRPVSHGDMETLLYLFDTAGLPIEVILMVIAYAVSVDKLNMRYVERVALDWADKGVSTIAAAEELLCTMERRHTAGLHVQTLLGLSRPFTAGQQETAEKWLCEWKLSDALIELANEQCLSKIAKTSIPYINRILEGWYADGVDTPEKAKAVLVKAKPKSKALQSDPEQSSMDLDEYEKMVKNYIPVYEE